MRCPFPTRIPSIVRQILKWDSWEDTFLGEQVFRVFFRHELERPAMNFQKLMTTVALFSSLGGTDVNATKAKQSLAFKIYDQDGNGVIDWRELSALLRITMHTNEIFLSSPQVIVI